MKSLLFLANLILILSLLSCSKDDSNFNCNSLKQGLIKKDRALVKSEVNKLLNGFNPQPSISDPGGHLENLNNFITDIQKCNQISCELDCYNCFHQLTMESLVKFSTDSSGIMINRTIFISTSEDMKMSFMDIL
jgi:hypothetical protein